MLTPLPHRNRTALCTIASSHVQRAVFVGLEL
jgi:hypothetical protein